MASNLVETYLAYAELQIAAEAVFPETFTSGRIDDGELLDGNNRSSKFPDDRVAPFVREWEVVDHKANTGTGFSGTLFKYTGSNDETRGLVNGQLVMSFRSTEFIDDVVRDNQATNAMEIKEFGWAFGQIADMRNWYEGLVSSGNVPTGAMVDVTGYSLGGHLATAFNLLYPLKVRSTYTFNGAVAPHRFEPPLGDRKPVIAITADAQPCSRRRVRTVAQAGSRRRGRAMSTSCRQDITPA